MAAETQYTANIGMATISTGTSSMTGSGSTNVLTAAASEDGTFIKTITIKAQTDTDEGVVRLFLSDPDVTKLFMEVEIPAVIKSSEDKAFEKTIPVNFLLKPGWILKASTENTNTFNVIAEGQDWDYYSSSVRAETTQYTINNGVGVISSGTSSMTGSGSTTVLSTSYDCNIWSITIKAIQTTSPGMVRIFLYDGTNTKLFKEIEVPAVIPSATAKAFYKKITFENGFVLNAEWNLKASTEKTETFNIITEFSYWTYPA